MNNITKKRLILALFSVCVMTGVNSLHGMKQGKKQGQKTGYVQTVDLNKELEAAIVKCEMKKIESLFDNGVDVNRANESGETQLFISIKSLNLLPTGYIGDMTREDLDLSFLLENIKEGTGRDFAGRLDIIKFLFTHGAAIDDKSAKLSKELFLKSPNVPEYFVLDKYMKWLSGYAKQANNLDRVKYIKSKALSNKYLEFDFLIKVCFARSLQEVNLNIDKDIKNTAIKMFHDAKSSLDVEYSSEVLKSLLGDTYYLKGAVTYDNTLGSLFEKQIKAAAIKNHYYLRPNFFSPVKTVVKKVPVKPTTKPAPVKSQTQTQTGKRIIEM